MPLERSRQLIGGVWKYVTASQSDNGGNGGAGPVELVRVSIAFDTPNLQVQSFPQVSADQATSTFVIAGNHAALFTAGSFLTSTSSLNSGVYEVVSSSFGGGNTSIVVVESVADEGADGAIINATTSGATTAGAVAYIPTPGDILIRTATWIGVSPDVTFDGTTPTIFPFMAGAADYQNDIQGSSGTQLDVGPTPGDSGGQTTLLDPVLWGITSRPLRFDNATPLMVVVDDGNYGAPGSTLGQAEILLWIISA